MLRFLLFLGLTPLLLSHSNGDATCKSNDNVYSFKFGEWNASIIKDGPIRGIENFFTVPSFVVIRALRYYYPNAPLEASQNMLLLQNNNEVVLIDTGSGLNLISRMSAVGLSPRDVTAILVTHIHFDHSTGALDSTGGATFPNARLYMHVEEDRFWGQSAAVIASQAPNLPFFLVNQTVTIHKALKTTYGARMRLLNDRESPIGGITAMLTQGHTPGHLAYMLASRGDRLLVVGDTLPSRTTLIQHPEWNIFSDTNVTQAISTRYILMDKLVQDKTMILSYHEQFPGLGYIVQDGPSFDFSTASKLE